MSELWTDRLHPPGHAPRVQASFLRWKLGNRTARSVAYKLIVPARG
jgi:hypothetical protein